METTHQTHQTHQPHQTRPAHQPHPTHQPHQMPQRQVMPANRTQEVHRIASELYRQQADWVTFFRKILGVDGVVRQLFPSTGELTELEQTPEYSEIQQMLAKLRERGTTPSSENEPTRVITVRLPKSLHESLRTEAHERRTSMNKLCISKLLQMVDQGLIPHD